MAAPVAERPWVAEDFIPAARSASVAVPALAAGSVSVQVSVAVCVNLLLAGEGPSADLEEHISAPDVFLAGSSSRAFPRTTSDITDIPPTTAAMRTRRRVIRRMTITARRITPLRLTPPKTTSRGSNKTSINWKLK